jgi:hypothetical protein
MNDDLAALLNGVAGLAIGAAAATLSATIMKAELMPEQLKWMGTAGSVVTACVLVIAFSFRVAISKTRVKVAAMVVLIIAIICVVYLRATRVEEITVSNHNYCFMTGWRLSEFGESARERCLAAINRPTTDQLSDYDLIKCAGPDEIGSLYKDYSSAGVAYVFGYLILLSAFTLLVASVQLVPK